MGSREYTVVVVSRRVVVLREAKDLLEPVVLSEAKDLLLAVAFVVAGALSLAPAPVLAQAPSPSAIISARDRMAARPLWPGFDPRTIPLAIYDGTRTVLVHHPAPPAGFTPLSGAPGFYSMPGRHRAVTANSSDTIGGVMTATLMPPSARATAREIAAVSIHEAFHVFERAHHTSWSANEADAFTYPVDRDALAARRREYALLRLALAAPNSGDAKCHAAVALVERQQRFAAMNSEHGAYERKSELNEGLAQYVQWRALGASDARAVPDSMPMPGAARAHAYHAGPAWGRLLDRFASQWRDALEREDTLALDQLLWRAVGHVETERPRCGLTNEQRRDIDDGAAGASTELSLGRRIQWQSFEHASGPRLEIVADAALLWPQGFDPLNVSLVAPGELLHTRFVKAGNDHGTIEVLGRRSRTTSAGAHPLFNGMRALTVTGLDSAFVVRAAGDTVVIEARGVSGRFVRARVERSGDTTRVLLRAP